MFKVGILPIGQVNINALQFLQHGLTTVFPEIEADVLKTVMPIPKEAHNPYREQYLSTRVLAKMNDYVGKDQAQQVLGVVEVDL